MSFFSQILKDAIEFYPEDYDSLGNSEWLSAVGIRDIATVYRRGVGESETDRREVFLSNLEDQMSRLRGHYEEFGEPLDIEFRSFSTPSDRVVGLQMGSGYPWEKEEGEIMEVVWSSGLWEKYRA